MQPTEFPIERLGTLQVDLARRSESHHREAHDSDREERNSAGSYEAALAYLNAAYMVTATTQMIAADLDRAAAREREPGHPWPLERLQNLVSVHRDGSEPTAGTEWRQRYPRWGVELDGTDDRVQTLYLTPEAHGEGVIVVATEGNGTEYGLKTALHFNIPWDQWDNLVQLAERIRAGLPVPYDTAGNTRTKEGLS